jgi:hypothetical protein
MHYGPQASRQVIDTGQRYPYAEKSLTFITQLLELANVSRWLDPALAVVTDISKASMALFLIISFRPVLCLQMDRLSRYLNRRTQVRTIFESRADCYAKRKPNPPASSSKKY